MPKRALSIVSFCTALLMTGAASAGCILYQHRDYGGSRYALGHLDRMKMVNGESLGCTTHGHGDGCESTLYEPSWNDQLSSYRVNGGCRVTMWQHVNEGGARWRSNKSYKYVGSRWNDEVSEVLCTC